LCLVRDRSSSTKQSASAYFVSQQPTCLLWHDEHGMFADEPEIVDEILEEIMSDRAAQFEAR
jgi:hypothetical protein